MRSVVFRLARDHAVTKPEWFRTLRTWNNKVAEHLSPELVALIETALSLKSAPRGWRIAGPLAEKLGVDWRTVSRIAARYRQSNPEYFKRFRSAHRTNVEHFSPKLVAIIKKETRVPRAPRGWCTYQELCVRHSIGEKAIKEICAPFRSSHPQYFRRYKNKQNRIFEHLSPRIIREIERRLLPFAPKNWRTINALAKELGISSRLAKKTAFTMMRNPELDYRPFRIPGGNRKHLCPEMVAIVKERMTGLNCSSTELSSPPPGWTTAASLAEAHNVPETVVNRLIGAERPQPFQLQRHLNFRGYIVDFVAPEIADRVREQLFRLDYPPTGYTDSTALAERLAVPRSLIWETAKKLRRERKIERVGMYLCGHQTLRRYYAPAQVDHICLAIESGRTDWRNIDALAKNLSIPPGTIDSLINFSINPPSSEILRTKSATGGTNTRYSDKVALALRHSVFTASAPKDDFIPLVSLRRKVALNQQAMHQLLKEIAGDSPGLIVLCRDQNSRLALYTHTSIEEKIKLRLALVQQAEPTWKTSTELELSYSMSALQIASLAESFALDFPSSRALRRDQYGRISVYYSGEFDTYLKAQHLLNFPYWVKSSFIAKRLAFGTSEVLQIAECFRESHPHWFLSVKQKGQAATEVYSLQLYHRVRNIVSGVERSPADWLPESTLARRLKLSLRELRKAAIEHKAAERGWMAEYLVGIGQVEICYSDKFIERLAA